jgi:tRNA pseudouridine55 synthase
MPGPSLVGANHAHALKVSRKGERDEGLVKQKIDWLTRSSHAPYPCYTVHGQPLKVGLTSPAEHSMKTSPHLGLLVLDKPGGMTSRDAVDRAQRWFPRGTRIGHTGTLDPLAAGVLVLCVGSATRLTEYIQDMGKTYRAGVRLGARSDTDDADGCVTPVDVSAPPELDAVRVRLDEFLGPIRQVPPAFSAAKVTGRRAYDMARRGEEVALAARTVRIDGIDVLAYAWPRLELEVRCGKGTYIRSLARDLGERLGCGGLIETLRRTRVGPFTIDDAIPLDAGADFALARLQSLEAAVAELPRLEVLEAQAVRLRQGQRAQSCRPWSQGPLPPSGREVAVFGPGGVFVGVCRLDGKDGYLSPLKIFLPEKGAS